MSKRRVYELAKEQGLSSKELLERLQAAGMDARAAASSVEEAQALKVLGESASPNTAAAARQSPGAAPRGPEQPAGGEPQPPVEESALGASPADSGLESREGSPHGMPGGQAA